MDPELWETLEMLFVQACRLPLEEQTQFAEKSTEGNQELKEGLRRMLKGHHRRSVLDAGIGTVLGDALSGVEPPRLGRIGPYDLVKKLGAGGMGVVHLAARQDWDIQVAIKEPRDVWISPEHLERFQSEQRLLAQLTHPAIARIYEGGTRADGTPWFAMEYVDGEPITSYCQKENLPAYDRLRLFVAVCEAIHYAHSQLIIHRDLKPSNIFVTRERKVKLLDFGIAKQLGEAAHPSILTKTGFHPITLAYAAPEQILRNEVSIKTDIYALGVLLYELLTNQLPYDLVGLNAIQGGEMVRDTEPLRPSAVTTRLAGLTRRQWDDLDVLIVKAMHKDAAQRYRTVDALMADVLRFLVDEPLEARGDSSAYRARKFVKRNQRTLVFAATAAAMLIGFTVFYLLSLIHARNAAFEEVARTRRVTQLVRDMLSGGEAGNGSPQDMKVIDLLDMALQRTKSLTSDPVQQAELYTTLGTVYTDLGQFGKAEMVLHSAYRILANHAPVSHDLAEVLVVLGVLYSRQSNDEHSFSCMQKAVNVERQITPPDKALLFRSRTGMALALLDSNPGRAVQILNDLLKEPESDTTKEARSDVWNDLATAYINLGQYENAEPYIRRALTYSQETRPAIHPEIATELINLSMIERELRRYSAAEGDLRKALSIDSAWYPKGHQETADVKRMLANVLLLENRLQEARPLAQEAVQEEQKSLGPTNVRTAYAWQILGQIELRQGHGAEASSLFEQEVAALDRLKDATNLPKAFAYLGDAYMLQKRFNESEHAYRKALQLCASSLVPAARFEAQDNRKLGEVLIQQGRFAAAEAPLLASYKAWAAAPNDPAGELRMVREDLLKVYEVLRRETEIVRFRRELSGLH